MNETEKEFEDEAVVHFLASAIDKTNTMVQHIDDQINILIGIGIAAFVFSTTKLDSSNNKIVFAVIGISAALSAIVGLFAIHPPRFMRKKGQKESIIFPSQIAQMNNVDDYIAKMKDTSVSIPRIIEECSRELYNMSKYYYAPKRQLYRWSRNLFLTGIALSLAVYIFKLK